MTCGKGPGAWVLSPPLRAWRRHQAPECPIRSLPHHWDPRPWRGQCHLRLEAPQKGLLFWTYYNERKQRKKDLIRLTVQRTWSLLPGMTTQLIHVGRGPINTQWRKENWVLRHSCTHSHTHTKTHMHAHTDTHALAHTSLSWMQCP